MAPEAIPESALRDATIASAHHAFQLINRQFVGDRVDVFHTECKPLRLDQGRARLLVPGGLLKGGAHCTAHPFKGAIVRVHVFFVFRFARSRAVDT